MADVSTRILAALHRRDAGAAPGRRPVDPRQMTINWGAPEPATEQPAPVSAAESPPAAKPSNSSPQYDVSRSEYDGKTQLIFKHGGKEVGEIAAVTRPDGNWEVSNVLVWPGFQRQGHGTAFYRRLADEAHRQGKRLFISNDRTDDAKALHAQAERAGWLKPTGEIAFPTNPPPAPPAAAPPTPEDAATVRKRERERWTGQLDRIGVGDSGYVGGVFVRRTGPSVWRTETERGFVQGDAERMLQHVASVRQDVGLYGRQLKEALARFKNAPRNAAPGGGSLFGGDDLQAQRGFARLPQGAAVAITEGGYKGRVGRIVREEVAPGRYRVLVRPEGSSEAIPIHHGSVEPLDPKLSWRADRSDQPPPTRQSKLFRRGTGRVRQPKE